MRIEIDCIRVPPPQLASSRVAARVKRGGHNVPRSDVLRRYKRGWTNFLEVYRPFRPCRFIQCSRTPHTVRVIHQQSTTPRLYIPRMEYARLETALLKDVTDDYYYGCHCTSCLHTARLSLSKLRAHLGGDYPLVKIRERLKCQICSSRKVTITFLGPHQKGGNLHHLFDKEAR